MRQVLGIVAVLVVATAIYLAVQKYGTHDKPQGAESPTAVLVSVAATRAPAATAAPPPTPEPTPTVALMGRDAEDDRTHPELAGLFPPSNRVGNWIKAEPVRVVEPERLADVVGDRVSILRPYHIHLASAAQYGRQADGRIERCAVEIIEADDPADAYGMLTVMAANGKPVDYGVIGRATSDTEFHIWQDKLYVHVKGDSASAGSTEAAAAVSRLAGEILFGRTKPMPVVYPRILEKFPPKTGSGNEEWTLAPGQQWVVRSMASLAAPGAQDLPIQEQAWETINNLLKLGPETLMAISAYQSPAALRPNYVWAVEYKDPREASKAFAAYSEYLKRAGDSLARTSLIEKPDPTGPYVIGTWTAEEESLSYVLIEMARLMTARP